jgi:hypothetical protein
LSQAVWSDEQQEPDKENAVSNTSYAFTSATLEKKRIGQESTASTP